MSRPALTIGAIAMGLVLNALVPATGVAQDWPTRPVTMVVPLAAGGAIDAIGRILNPPLSEILRQQVIIENVGGAGGMIGAHRVAKAPPDGYQFVFGTAGTHAQNQTLYKQPRYNAATDFAPVALIAEMPLVLIATVVDAAADVTGDGGGGLCGAPVSGQNPPLARDSLLILKTAVGLPGNCRPCECDVNSNGSLTASDSLLALRAAIWTSGVSLICPETCDSFIVRPADPGTAAVAVSSVVCDGDPPTTTTTTTLDTTTTTTLPVLDCSVTIRRTDTSTDNSLQYEMDYGGAGAALSDSGSNVDCTNLATGLVAFYDDDAAEVLGGGLVSLDGATFPSDVARCDFTATSTPTPADFDLTVIDVASGEAPAAGGGLCAAPVSGQSPPLARDSYHILQAAVGLDVECRPCECDVNNSSIVTASDSLIALRAAVGQPISLNCPGPCDSFVVRPADPGTAVLVATSIACEAPTTTTTTTLAPTTTTTLPPTMERCEITIGRTDGGSFNATQLSVDYAAAQANSGTELDGAGTLVSCTNQVSSALVSFYDDQASHELRLGIVTLNGASGPLALAKCTVTAATPPVASDFAVTVVDSAIGAQMPVDGGLCGGPASGESPPFTRDSAVALRTAVGLVPACPECSCDVNSNGSITASDSLQVLRAGVAEDASVLACQGACISPVVHGHGAGSAAAEVTSVNCDLP